MGNNEKPVQTEISVIIPAFNEETAIGPQVNKIQHVLTSHNIKHEIIVVDDGSEDLTAKQASKTSAHVLRLPENQGYGMALKTGILVAKYETDSNY